LEEDGSGSLLLPVKELAMAGLMKEKTATMCQKKQVAPTVVMLATFSMIGHVFGAHAISMALGYWHAWLFSDPKRARCTSSSRL
jgi:hypothetical protein